MSFYKFLSISILVSLLGSMVVYVPEVRAGVLLKHPTYLGLGAGLVGNWTMDGKDTVWTSETAATTADNSGNGNTGTLTNMNRSTAPVIGRLGQALEFDGVDDEITVASDSSLNPSAITISMWIKLIAAPTDANNSIIEKESNNGYRIRCSTVAPCAPQLIFNGTFGASASNLSLDSWTHLVLVADSNGSRFYTNAVAGTLDTDVYVASASSGNLRIGTGAFGTFVNADIDEVRVYNRVLSASDVERLYNIGTPSKINTSRAGASLTSGLVGHWTLDGADTPWTSETAATTADKSGNSNTGTLNGMTRSSAPTIGKLGQALSFDGTDDFVSAPETSLVGATVFTISAWIYPRSRSDFDGIVVSRGTETIQFGLGGSGGVGNDDLQLWTDLGSHCSTGNTNVITNNTWHYVAVTYSGSDGTCFMYHNGVDRTGSSIRTHGSFDLDDSIKIGQDDSGGRWFDGYIDEVRIYNRVLTAAEVNQLYQMGVPSNVNSSPTTSQTSGLVGYWTFDGGDTPWTSETAATTLDKSGNSNTGTLNGMTRSSAPTIGKLGQGLDFTNSPYVITNNITIPTDFSISVWIKTSSGAVNNNIAGWGTNIRLSLKNSCTGSNFWFSVDGGACGAAGGGSSPSDGQWHHITAVNIGNTQTLYLDGTSIGTGTETHTTGSAQFNIGRSPSNSAFTGVIDEVRLYNRALTAENVKQLYLMGNK